MHAIVLAVVFHALGGAASAQDCFIQTPVGGGDNGALAVALQADGKIVVAGYSLGVDEDFTIIRYNADLSLDLSFGGTGVVVTPVGFGNDRAQSVAIQPDGKIVAAGFGFNGTDNDFALARYNPNGSLDTTFDSDGWVLVPVGSFDAASGVAVQSDGRIVAAGYATVADDDFAVVRLNANGSLDISFDGDGKVTTSVGTFADFATSVSVQVDGRLVVGGYAWNGTDFDAALARYDANGSLDTSFDVDGKVTTPIGLADDRTAAMAVQTDGQIVLAGAYDNGIDYDWFVVRYDTDGSLDTSFHGDGIAVTPIGSAQDFANAVAVQPNDAIIVAGQSNNGTDEDFAVARFTSDGNLDAAFDSDGIVTTPLLAAGDFGSAVAIEADGRIVVAGSTDTGADFDQALVRYEKDGSVACGQISLHPTGDGSVNGFSDLTGCPASNWECVNDQPGDAGTGVAVANDGSATVVRDGDLLTNREMFILDDGEVPLGATITEIELRAQVGTSDPLSTVGVSYQRMGWDAIPVDSPGFGFGSTACCSYAISWTVGGLNWSTAELDALEIGFQHVSGGIAEVSQIYVTVTYLLPPTSQDYFRSIGTRGDYGTVEPEGAGTTLTAANGYDIVTGSGTSWLTANRGRGDRITIEGIDYMVRSVDAEDVLTLTTPFVGASGSGKSYTIARQFATLQDWENCISGAIACASFPVGSSSLVLDNRNETGIAYSDSPFLPVPAVVIDGAITDADHAITLTADAGNRHNGVAGAGVVIDGQNGLNGIEVLTHYVTVEWLELIRVRGGGGGYVLEVDVPPGPTSVLLQNLLIHDFYDAIDDITGIGLGGTGMRSVTIRNVMIWDGDNAGIEGDEPSDTIAIDNVSIDGMENMGISTDLSVVTVRNTLVTSSPGGDFVGVFDASSDNNASTDTSAPGASSITGVLASNEFVVAGSDLHLKAGAFAEDSGIDLSSSFTGDIDGAPRPGGAAWDIGADERGAPGAFRINYRSIGTSAADLKSGLPTVTISGGTATFSVAQASNVGLGDEVTYGGPTIAYIASRVSSTVYTLSTSTGDVPPDVAGSPVTSIKRAFNALQAWETGREGDLVGENRREVGVVYSDGVFNTALQIEDSITDANRYMKLTVAPLHRHTGTAGTGAAVDGLNTTAGQVEVSDDYSVVEWLEVRGVRGSGTVAGVRVRNARNVLLSNLLVHDNREGLRMSGDGGNDFSVRNSFIFKNDDDGIGGDEITDTVTVDNCTIFGNLGDGIDESAGTTYHVTNTISMANVSGDFDFASGTQSYNISSDGTASGAGSLQFRNATDIPTAAPNFVVFTTLTAGSENFHLRASAVNDAVDTATDLSSFFTDDIDGVSRSLPWDIGADELGLPAGGVTISSNNNQSFVVGSLSLTAATITIVEGAFGGSITDTGDIRIRIPPGLNMRWDTSVATVTLAGLGAGNISTMVKAYEDGDKTVVLDVTSDFLPSDDVSIDDLKFASFTAPSSIDNLELEVFDDDLVSALDDKTIVITAGANPVISSDADQVFTDGDPATPASPIAVSDATAPVIAPGNDIRIVVPPGLNMTWDGAILTPSFGGPAALKVDSTVSYVGGDTVLAITVNTPFAAGDYLVISGVQFANFVGPSAGSLELEIGAVPTDTDDKIITVLTTGTVQVFAATSTSTNNHLAWVNPTDPSYVHTRILAREDGVFPTDPLDLGVARLVVDHVGTMGQKEFFDDSGLTDGKTYYYTAFVFDGTNYSKGIETRGRPFDHLSGDVGWAYFTGATAMAPPALRFESATRTYIYAVSNDSIVHSMDGSGSVAPGEWPANWKPFRLGGVAQARPPVVPFAVGIGATKGAVFVGSQDGTVYAVDADTGGLEWQSAAVGNMLTAATAGIFTNFGAPYHYLAIGTRNSAPPNVFSGLDPDTGSIDWTFDNSVPQGGDGSLIGIISGGASVDYQDPGDGSRYFFFASRSAGSPDTVWCIKWDGASVNLVWSSNLPGITGNPNIDGSPMRHFLYGGRIYVGTNQGEVVALDAATGTVEWTYDTNDGAVKGFLFPQFGTTNLIFSTTNKVWSLSDDGGGASLNPNWPASFVPFPSIPLYVPGTTHVLVGSSDGQLYQLDVVDPSVFVTEKLVTGGGAVGMPTVDLSNSVIYVGTEGGVIYAIDYPILP